MLGSKPSASSNFLSSLRRTWRKSMKNLGRRELVFLFLIIFAAVPWVLYAVFKWDQRRRAQHLIDAAMQGRGVLTFDWREAAFELKPIWDEMEKCSTALTQSIPVSDMSLLYTCEVGGGAKMQRGGACTEEGFKHLRRILVPLEDEGGEHMLDEYSAFEKENRGHGAAATQNCGYEELPVSSELQAALGSNVSLALDDLTPCHSHYRFLSNSETAPDVLGPPGNHFATTHHLGSISYKKTRASEPGCTGRLTSLISSKLGVRRMQWSDPLRTFRGMYWYPPFGFTEWHTDGNHVNGWRIYLAHIDVEHESYFVHKQGSGSVAIPDRHFQANMFQVIPGQPLWHAVASLHAQRVSVGIAISQAYAEKIISRVAASELLERVGKKPGRELAEEVERHGVSVGGIGGVDAGL